MNPKSLILLEYHKVLEKLKAFTTFPASAQLAIELRPTANLEKAQAMQKLTREARLLLETLGDLSFEGAADLRPLTDQALHSVTLEAQTFLFIRNTLQLSRDSRRQIENQNAETPALKTMAEGLSDGSGLIDHINRTISERGEVLDSASAELKNIRSEMKVTHARLFERLERYINEPRSARMLQETLITTRNGRYVLPLRSEFKGQIKGLVHDQSSSGATLFVEPLVVVEWNNKYKELELAERDEILRVLRALTQRIAEDAPSLNATTEAMAGLDLALAKARYAESLRAAEPVLTPFKTKTEEGHPGSAIQLIRARHPLLDQSLAVPINVQLDEQTFAVVLTGPNTGGKTVTLKTVGLAVLMAQSGMQIPAQSGSRLSLFKDVFADIGDEQSIEQSLSTFSGHITQLVKILRHADRNCLVLLDELGAGTDPQEGSALARAVLSYLIEKKITCLVATHYPELKLYAHTTPGAINASLEFDLQTLRPTYRLVIGLPGRSNALAIAERLGLSPQIIQAARQELNPTDLRADDLLDEIHRQRNLAETAYLAADEARKEAENLRNKANARLEQLDREKANLAERAETRAQQELDLLREELDELRKAMSKLRQPSQKLGAPETATLKDFEQKLDHIEARETQKARKAKRQPKPRGQAGPLKIGEKVLVRKLKVEGLVTSLNEDEIEVQVGSLRLRLKPMEIERKRSEEAAEKAAPETAAKVIQTGGRTSLPGLSSPGMELDLRGERAEDALDRLRSYLERAWLAGLPFGRIIHGKGTGILRQIIREEIRQFPQAKRWESGGEKEGGEGVTIVFFENR
ncbi:MAG: endonuclease MutS2 [Anaerolineaceae bacterium]|nr:endonuclease MutS2 [Anaerolineaceae bacterium]